MTSDKRRAWIHIYNKWIENGRKERGTAFYELFRDYKNVSLPSDASYTNLMKKVTLKDVDYERTYLEGMISNSEEAEMEMTRNDILTSEYRFNKAISEYMP
jgi:hypothetical protein